MGVPEATKKWPGGTEQRQVSPGSALLKPALEEKIKHYGKPVNVTARQRGERARNSSGKRIDEESEDGMLQKRRQGDKEKREKRGRAENRRTEVERFP
ncbi:hypothetical protein NDU88_003207 [Pleurodeles waltl]|uniref:Uncharacterized protein n=1 Tax=Pleurodeles waltl TaxID=8319 RepID=A0AAV7MQ38_PLEWA|nr:hypothetical protein NDU88_003207 [Pleurodeles waltl]